MIVGEGETTSHFFFTETGGNCSNNSKLGCVCAFEMVKGDRTSKNICLNPCNIYKLKNMCIYIYIYDIYSGIGVAGDIPVANRSLDTIPGTSQFHVSL